MSDSTKKGIRPIIATVILIAVAVAIAIAVAFWAAGLVSAFTRPEILIKWDIRIYASEKNIGVLNENGTFIINITNEYNTDKIVNLKIFAEDIPVDNGTLLLTKENTTSIVRAQKLYYPGIWRITISDDKGSIIDAYSFKVLTNRDDAYIAITESDHIDESVTTSRLTLLFSGISIAISMIALLKSFGKLKRVW